MIDNGLHWIDRPRKPKEWTRADLDRMLVFCLLDRAMPYGKVKEAFDALEKRGFTTRAGLRNAIAVYAGPAMRKVVASTLKAAGHRFPSQASEAIVAFVFNGMDLATASREEMVGGIHGIGMKLASMFLRNTRGKRYAVIDVHLRRWLEEQGCAARDYEAQEAFFLDYCKRTRQDPYELDMRIWNERRA